MPAVAERAEPVAVAELARSCPVWSGPIEDIVAELDNMLLIKKKK